MYSDIKHYLLSIAEDGKRDFDAKIIGSKRIHLGVRTPEMRVLVKKVLKGEFGAPLDLLKEADDDTYEDTIVQGCIITGAKIGKEERQTLIDAYVPKIDNWASCDTLVGGCKFVGKDLDGWWDYCVAYLGRDREFEIRYGVGMLMDYYLVDKYIDRVLELLSNVKNDAYYVKMGVAWAYATAAAKYFDKTVKYLENGCLEKWVHNKSIQKGVESYRLSEEQKAHIRTLRRK